MNEVKISVVEGNRLIAKFMGAVVDDFQWKNYHRLGICDSDGSLSLKDCEFFEPDHDWNQLMSVVDKIESLGYDTNIYNDEDCQQMMVWDGKVYSYNRKVKDVIVENGFGNRSKINAVWLGVIEFINWFNSQQK